MRREAKRTVLTAEAVDGADEAAVELARPPQPGHRGPVVPPRCRRPVPPAAGAAHLSRRSAQAASGDDDLRLLPLGHLSHVEPCGAVVAGALASLSLRC